VHKAANSVLVIDHNRQSRRYVAAGLELYGYSVTETENGAAGLSTVMVLRPDLIILDPDLPDMNGADVLKTIQRWMDVPVIILSMRTEEEQKVRFLRGGADDYMAKPLAIAELAARCETALRRHPKGVDRDSMVRTGPLTLDLVTHDVTLNDRNVMLTRQEYQLLHLLASHLGLVITHDQIIQEIWGNDSPDKVQYLRSLVRRLRQKLEADPSDPQLLISQAGVGYRLARDAVPSLHATERRGFTLEQAARKGAPEVVDEKTRPSLDPYFRECVSGRAIEFQLDVDLPHLASEPQFVGKRAETALCESESTFRAMFEVSGVGEIEVDPNSGRFLRANAAMCKFVGYSEAELLARTVYDITHPDDRNIDHKPLRRLVAGECAGFGMEKRYIRKDGSVVWAQVTVNAICDGSGLPLRNTGVVLDISAHKQAEQALQATTRLQLAIHAAGLGWWRYDPRHRTFSGDIRSREIFDTTSDDMPIGEIRRQVHPEDAERFRVACEATFDPKPHAMEFRLQRGDGEVRWVELHWLTYFEDDGRDRRAVSVVGTVADITARKEREARERLLMCEINHRTKNMLSVVQVIAQQTAIRIPEDFAEHFSERIQALSANQDLLIRSEWNGVEIEALVRTQLAHFADLIGSRIVVQGPKLCLKPGSAQAVGLALYELATNAGKYGALSNDTGRVDIRWETDGDTFAMNWAERDGPRVSPPKQRGFGTIVIEAMVGCSVDGAVDLDYAPLGVTWRLICPVANALERAAKMADVR
jgi:two-component system, OmpR family, KDP operon response regulator KdpE